MNTNSLYQLEQSISNQNKSWKKIQNTDERTQTSDDSSDPSDNNEALQPSKKIRLNVGGSKIIFQLSNWQLDSRFYDSVQSNLERVASHDEAMSKLAQQHLQQLFKSDNPAMDEIWKQQSNKRFIEFMFKVCVVIDKHLGMENANANLYASSNNDNTEQNFKPSANKKTMFDKHWKEHFDELVTFKQMHGHCNASRTMKGYEQLGNWLADQRRKYRKGKLTEEQYKILTDLGVEWDRSTCFWRHRLRS